MKLIPSSHELISNMRAFFQTNNSKLNYLNEEPLRAELLSTDQLEKFGKTLAEAHHLSTKPAKDHLLKRLADNEAILNEVRKLLTDSIKSEQQIAPAGEWLIDNFYLIEEHIRNAKMHFPKDYSEDLPQLSDHTSEGLTRIYDIVLKIISHSDGRIDIDNLSGFLTSYQTVTNLKLGELWAIPIMLRLGLIENLRRVSARIAIDRVDKNLANYWAHLLIETTEKNPKNLILVIADMARSKPPIGGAFVSEMIRQLRGKGPDLALVLNWMEQQLSESGLTSSEMVNAEIQKQAADQVSMSNSIGSLRLLGAMDWRDFVENHSIVEQILREDNKGIYGLMDFSTRDHYRHAVEHIAKKSKIPEKDVAKIAIQLMQENASAPDQDERTSHVGYYLIGAGARQTRKLAGMHESILAKTRNVLKAHSFKIYISIILLLTYAISQGILEKAESDTDNIVLLTLIFILSLICASQLAISVVDFFSTLTVRPNLLPRMDFSEGLPPLSRSMVVVPSMIGNAQDVETLIESLEVRFLANRNENLHFGLLTDFADAASETLPADEELANLAVSGINQLNIKYHRENKDLFYFFHRPRLWNPKENAWMGHERKRGKLSDLNFLLRGTGAEKFSVIIGDTSIFPSVKYIITLDEDTQLPLGSAWKLVGSMAHPLNHAWYNPQKKRVTRGYGILQPRVTVSLPDITSSLYTRMHGNEPGIDPYTKASSDVYQDLFGEGSFIGKGIYDIDIFNKVLDDRFAENSILSHDLLEGCYVRSGLLSDVQLFEKYPGSYRADIKRRIRWTRGDWQIFAWFLPFVPDRERHWRKNPISALSRWKIFDNIRRSIFPIALTMLLLVGIVFLPSSLFWTIAVTAIIIIPIIISTAWNALRKPKDVFLSEHLKNFGKNLTGIFEKTIFTFICLPYEAVCNVLTIFKTLWRMIITRKHLLEWNPSAKEEIFDKESLAAAYSSMWIECLFAIGVFFYLVYSSPSKLVIATPIFSLWLLSPLVTWLISLPVGKQVTSLTYEQNIFLRKMARKTWRFFEYFVTESDNWLPPDNFQEQPVPEIAHRTSPTNIGLSLLSNVSAYDFGYITSGDLIDRTKKVLDTMEKMERYKGHFYNWYDTESLAPLIPKYISTVDSGNLVGALLVLKQGLLSIPHKKIISDKVFEGIIDTFMLLKDSMGEKESGQLFTFKKVLDTAFSIDLNDTNEVLLKVEELSTVFSSEIENVDENPESDIFWWKERLNKQLQDLKEELQILAPFNYPHYTSVGNSGIATSNVDITLTGLLKSARNSFTDTGVQNNSAGTTEENEQVDTHQNSLNTSIRKIEERIDLVETLARQCDELADMEWDFLFSKSNNLLTIGYNVQEHHIDPGFYDLLASEARLCVFICIAQGKLPEASWFALGRLLTNVGGHSILLSWSGSMFEYLMPLLIMPTYENTLLDQTYKAAVQWQIDFGKKRGLPWGISESGYNMLNANANYQYRAFGAPGLGLKRGLEEDSVIAPYASALGLMVAPEKATENMELLSAKGFEGKYGHYEAIDYTPSRLKHGESSAIVYSFMAHHQGMSLLSMAYLLLDRPMQKLFEAEPQFKATMLLLQERIPKASTFFAHTTEIADINYVETGTKVRIINTPNTPLPDVQLLSNGRYHVMLTNAGGGYSRWKDLAVTRWREDGTRDNWGTFCYIRDVQNETFWSNTHQPTLKKSDKYEAAFSQGRVDFRTSHNNINAHTEIMVSAEDDIEMRRVHLTNCSSIRRTIEVTSYTEVVLAYAASDIMQPAFSNLFVQTEIIPNKKAILCTRRARSMDEKPPWLFHLMTIQGKNSEEISFESDRNKFIGRGKSTINPDAMNFSGLLSGSDGSVLDPIVAIRHKITIEPDETITVDMIIGVAETKETCLNLIDKYNDRHHKDRVFELAWTHSQVVLRQINATEADAQLYGRLASSIIFTNIAFRAEAAILINNHKGQSGLWGYSISGDLPIILLKVQNQDNMQMVQQMIQAHAYWRLKGLAVDLVIWNEEHSGYRQVFQNDIQALIPAELVDRPGGIFVRASDQISNEDRILFQTVARINISDNEGSLAEHIKRKALAKVAVPYIQPSKTYKPSTASVSLPDDLVFFNGLGGFSPDGSEYVISTENKNRTPAPWVNVIANPHFGSVISESGSSYTWIENAHELRLTPWNNDPVSDCSGEAFYLRDEESGHFWSTTLLPKGSDSPYITRHGFGYSAFEHLEDGIHSEMLVYVDNEEAVKFTVLKIKNQSGKARKLSATGYIEWVLGTDRMKTAMYIHTEIDPETGAVFAKNPYNSEFSNRIAFFDVDFIKKSHTGDRTEFLGRNGSLQNPDAMSRVKLSGKMGLALDPCGAIQVPFDLEDGEEEEIIFRIGTAKDNEHAVDIVRRFRGNVVAQEALEKVKNHWQNIIGAIKVETPDTGINFITNGWLTYQVLTSRLWGRSGYYQSGGAFGFRDQLQDVMSLLHTVPELAREQILLCSSRQFKEGDVQHWWHPPMGRGVRTRCSDDFLWLPYVTSMYVSHTGDAEILDEVTPYLDGRQLNFGEESYYDLPVQSGISARLYDHCVQAIKHGLNFGEHGLPLIGTGDWNDGFDRVGIEGKGESVWMAFFLYEILGKFSKVARLHLDEIFALECENQAKKLKENIDKNAWDGEWYKRAWFDNGTPLGSSKNKECRIDSIAQSWSVLSGAGEASRINIAMESAYKNLVQKDSGIIQLLEPPFDNSDLNPGYIKGYVPGVRENGGQYTHAAIWMIIAFARLGNNERVWELLNMINPVNHGKTETDVATYKVEPYVLAADVYARAPHAGRGGWTWYTGSAGWMYRLITESFLGLQQEDTKLRFIPCIPVDWQSFKVQYRYKKTLYHIVVEQRNGEGKMLVTKDGEEQPDNSINLTDDGFEHNVQIILFNLVPSLGDAKVQATNLDRGSLAESQQDKTSIL